MVLPGALWFLVLKYIPIMGTIIAFKDFRIDRRGFIFSIINSKWVGFSNFKFMFATNDAFIAIRNTLFYNVLWIFIGLIISVSFAIMLNELNKKCFRKIYQTAMFFPYFLSWVVVAYFVYSFLSPKSGVVNNWMEAQGMKEIMWYMEPKYWPFILTFVNIWKTAGYGSVIYLAAIIGIDESYYEAAMIDGANRWKQIWHITLPLLKPMMIILSILALGRIFNSDFGMFYNVPRDSGALYSTTSVIDTYVYRGLMHLGNIGMSTAAGLMQSVVGFILILTTNAIIRRIEPDSALY